MIALGGGEHDLLRTRSFDERKKESQGSGRGRCREMDATDRSPEGVGMSGEHGNTRKGKWNTLRSVCTEAGATHSRPAPS